MSVPQTGKTTEPLMAQTPTAYPGRTWQPGPAAYFATASEEVSLRMRDGMQLVGSVAYPAQDSTDAAARRRPQVVPRRRRWSSRGHSFRRRLIAGVAVSSGRSIR